jgi:hypothetical protein
MLTLNEFRATAQYYTPNDTDRNFDTVCRILSLGLADLQYQNGKAFQEICIFADGSGWIYRTPANTYCATIGNESLTGTFDDISAYVYFDHYARERIAARDIADIPENDLCELLDDYCRWQGWRYGCAMELWHEVGDNDVRAVYGCSRANQWLQWFCDTWEAWEDAQPEPVRAGRQYWYPAYVSAGRWIVAGPVTAIKPVSGGKWLVEHHDETRSLMELDADHDDRDTVAREVDGFNSRG